MIPEDTNEQWGGKARMGETPEGGARMDNWGSSCGGPFKGGGGCQSRGIHPLTPFFHMARVVPGAFNPQHFQACLQWGVLLWFFMQEALCGWEVSTAAAAGFRAELRGHGAGRRDHELGPHGIHFDWTHTGAGHCARASRDTPIWR